MQIDIDEVALILSGVQIMQDLDVDIIDDIASQTQFAEFKQGDMVVRAGDKGDRIYFIRDGKVEVQIPDADGEIRRRVVVKKGEVVGEISLLIKSNYTADIVALTDTSAYYLDSSRFQAADRKTPGVCRGHVAADDRSHGAKRRHQQRWQIRTARQTRRGQHGGRIQRLGSRPGTRGRG